MNNIRNVAIIAHVDHGKTTLVDALLRQSNTKLNKDVAAREQILDTNDLERERGITIFSKNASVRWNGIKINIIDTPGHADFGGEVERVLKLADGCLLLVDAKEGPMPQTRFVLKQALKLGHKIIVVINKIDKPDERHKYVLDKTFDLFLEVLSGLSGANDSVADFPVLYASAKLGKAGNKPDLGKMENISPVFDAIISHIPPPPGSPSKPLQILVTNIDYDSFKGRIATGRIYNGTVRNNQDVAHIDRNGRINKCRLVSLMTFEGLERLETTEGTAGDIIALAGVSDILVGETIADPLQPHALPLLAIEEPTVKMNFKINDSPFAGKEGSFSTSRQIRERLYKELEKDVALHIEDGLEGEFIVAGRGELHLAILIERMRREGYELQIARPQVITKEKDGQMLVPYEQVFIEVPEKYIGIVIQRLGSRHGEMQNMKIENGVGYLEFVIPTRGLFGYRSEFLNDAHGLGIFNSTFLEFRPDPPGGWKERSQGSLVAYESGTTNMYGLLNIQDRGGLFVGPGATVYKGQVVGQNSRSQDMYVNVCKTKQLSNMRSKGEGSDKHFNAPKIMGLEDALEYLGDDELVEVTPKSIRIRKIVLDSTASRRKEMGLV